MDPVFEAAVKNGDLDAIRVLLEWVDIDARDRYGQTALMLASRNGHAAIVAELIARGADMNVTAKFTLTALMLAIVNGHAEIARMLVHGGADPSIRGSGAPGFHNKTAYDLAVERKMLELCEELKG